MRRWIELPVAASFVFFLQSCALVTTPPNIPSLFLDVNDVSASAVEADMSPQVVQSKRLVRLNPLIVSKVEEGYEPTFRMNVANDMYFSLETEDISPIEGDTKRWLAVGPEGVSFRAIYSGGTIVGTIKVKGKLYRIHPDFQHGVHILSEIDQTGFPDRVDDYVVPPRTSSDLKMEKRRDICDEPPRVPGDPDIPPPNPPPGKGHRVQLLVLWTPAAQKQSADIERDILLMIEEIRSQWANGHFAVFPKITHMQKIDMLESADMKTDLDKLQRGEVSDVHQLRNKYRADLVALISSHRVLGGVGYVLTNPKLSDAPWGYSITHREAGIGYHTLAHELGHNFGMQHDRETVGHPTLGYNYGYISHKTKYRSIMAYNEPCRKRGYYCRKVGAYSSPNVPVITKPHRDNLGKPIGVPAAAHNMEVLCESAGIISKFR